MRIKLRHLYLMAAVCALAAGIALLPMNVLGSSTRNLTTLGFGYSDAIYNYDFENQAVDATHVDWAMSLLFYNNANVNKIKSILNSSYWIYGSSENAYLNDSGSWEWDSDGGRKTAAPSCTGSDAHYRVYAPSAFDDFYNPSFGYYLLGTTHHDHHELCDAWYDDSEGTESDIARRMSARGYYTRYDYAWFYNAQFETQGNHTFNNDGYATYIEVP
jgi:hypothetical protein